MSKTRGVVVELNSFESLASFCPSARPLSCSQRVSQEAFKVVCDQTRVIFLLWFLNPLRGSLASFLRQPNCVFSLWGSVFCFVWPEICISYVTVEEKYDYKACSGVQINWFCLLNCCTPAVWWVLRCNDVMQKKNKKKTQEMKSRSLYFFLDESAFLFPSPCTRSPSICMIFLTSTSSCVSPSMEIQRCGPRSDNPALWWFINVSRLRHQWPCCSQVFSRIPILRMCAKSINLIFVSALLSPDGVLLDWLLKPSVHPTMKWVYRPVLGFHKVVIKPFIKVKGDLFTVREALTYNFDTKTASYTAWL